MIPHMTGEARQLATSLRRGYELCRHGLPRDHGSRAPPCEKRVPEAREKSFTLIDQEKGEDFLDRG